MKIFGASVAGAALVQFALMAGIYLRPVEMTGRAGGVLDLQNSWQQYISIQRGRRAGAAALSLVRCNFVPSIHHDIDATVIPSWILADISASARSVAFSASDAAYWHYECIEAGWPLKLVRVVYLNGDSDPTIGLRRQHLPADRRRIRRPTVVWFPGRITVVLFAAGSIGLLASALRRRLLVARSLKGGRCPACGYPIGRSPAACPECGARSPGNQSVGIGGFEVDSS